MAARRRRESTIRPISRCAARGKIEAMPAHFDRLGISFQYPDNWTLDDSDALFGAAR